MSLWNSIGLWDTNRSPNPVQKVRLLISKKINCHLVEFPVSADYRVKINESEKDIQILRSCQRAEKAVEHKGDCDTNCSCCRWNGFEGPGKDTGGNGDLKKKQLRPSTQQHS